MPLTFKRFPIFKVSATGNDFLLVDLQQPEAQALWRNDFAKTARGEWVRRWCDRFIGLGADGAMFLEPADGVDFRWDFYNSDGGQAEMCGNAARAVSLYMSHTRKIKHLKFITGAGQVEGWVHSPSDIEIRMPAITEVELMPAYDFVRAGVPHAVLRVPAVKDLTALRASAAAIKREMRFASEGVNVTFVQNLGIDKIASVTFERGVEDFTRACGTGAVAAAYSLLKGEEQRKIEVQVPGGNLFVVCKEGRPHLSGPALVVAEMHIVQEE